MTVDAITVTGYGAVSPLGPDVSTVRARRTRCGSGGASITTFPTEGLETRFAGGWQRMISIWPVAINASRS